MSMGSMLYTMGTALDRARDSQVPVALLVEGQWIHGRVVDIDGHGVVLADLGAEHSVVKLDRVSAVRVMTEAPMGAPAAHEQMAVTAAN